MRDHIAYSFKIWITTIAVTPVLMILVSSLINLFNNGQTDMIGSLIAYIFLFIGGLVYFVGILFILILANYFIFKIKKQLTIRIINQVIVVLLFHYMFTIVNEDFNATENSYRIECAYLATSGFCIWFYRISPKLKKAIEIKSTGE